MLFFSPFSSFEVGIRSGHTNYHPITGVAMSEVKSLRAEFGRHGGEYTAVNPLTQRPETFAVIHGNYFDSRVAAEQNKWTPEELESVENRLIWLCGKRPDLIKLVETPEPVVMAPWPTYDGQEPEVIADFAERLGLVREALAYERVNLARPLLLDWLDELSQNLVDEDGVPIAGDLQNVTTPERPVYEPARGGERVISV